MAANIWSVVTQIARIPINNDGVLLFELPDGMLSDPGDDRSYGGTVPVGRRSVSSRTGATITDVAEDSLHKSLATVTQFTKGLYRAISAARPDEAEAEFGFDLGIDGGYALIVHGDVKCHVRVKLTWRAGDRESSANGGVGSEAGADELPRTAHDTGKES